VTQAELCHIIYEILNGAERCGHADGGHKTGSGTSGSTIKPPADESIIEDFIWFPEVFF
jgi:hypothetical protein